MTEDEARELWCPFARVVYPATDDSAGHNRVRDKTVPSENSYCIASGCMAWRWEWSGNLRLDTGYCGLAGPGP